MSESESKQRSSVEFNGVSKRFGDFYANKNLSFKARSGSIHGVVGENGAGKSTAMNLLYGLLRPTSGEIKIQDEPVSFRNPQDAIACGIGMVHQHFMLSEAHDAIDNIVIGPAKAALLRSIDREEARKKIKQLCTEYGIEVDLNRLVGELPVGVQQRIEILKLLYRDADIMILDEPTAVLTPQETDQLFENLRRLRDQGKTILVITHKLKEILSLTDRVTVFRRGEVVADRDTEGLTEKSLAELMVGREVKMEVELEKSPNYGAVDFKISDLSFISPKGNLSKVNLEIMAGEIFGIAGIEGNGQSTLLEFLLSPRTFLNLPGATGTYEINGECVDHFESPQMRVFGPALVPEDRHRQGGVLSFDLAENFLLGQQDRKDFSWGPVIQNAKLHQRTKQAIKDFDVRAGGPSSTLGSLSGGNQQKLIFAREMSRSPKVIIVAQPTRGVDIGAIELIHDRLIEERKRGACILLISSELDEILKLSDRVGVMVEGRIAKILERKEADRSKIGVLMAGGAA